MMSSVLTLKINSRDCCSRACGSPFAYLGLALPASVETDENAQAFRLQFTGFGFHVGHHVGQMVKMLADMMADMKILKMPINHGFFGSIESSWPT